MAAPGRDFQKYIVDHGDLGFFGRKEPGMSQDIDIRGHQRGPVSSRLDRLDRGFAMHDDNSGAEGFGLPGTIIDGRRRHVGQLYTGQSFDSPMLLRHRAVLSHFPDGRFHVGQTDMIRYRDGPIAGDMGAANQLNRRQNPVAEKRVRVKIKSHIAPLP